MKVKWTGFWVALFIFIVVGAYTATWFWGADNIDKKIDSFYAEAEGAGIEIDGVRPVVGGFPGKYKIRFFGRVIIDELSVEIPSLLVTGVFLPGQNVDVTMDNGLALRGPVDPEHWSLSFLHVNFTIPESIPGALEYEDLLVWHQNGGRLTVNEMSFEKRELNATGNGHLELDAELQPAGELNLKISGDYMKFLARMKEKGDIKTQELMLATMGFSALTKIDPETGESYVGINLILQNRNVLLGPLFLTQIPAVQWPGYIQPDPL